MSASAALPKVLDRIDADLDQSLERLFKFLRLQSISTDPAFVGPCRDAAKFVASANGGNQTVPTLKFADGSTLTNPSGAQVKAKLAS